MHLWIRGCLNFASNSERSEKKEKKAQQVASPALGNRESVSKGDAGEEDVATYRLFTPPRGPMLTCKQVAVEPARQVPRYGDGRAQSQVKVLRRVT